MKRNSHCSFCGQPFSDDAPWPRKCTACHNVTFVNPLPVAVVVQPVDQGLLLVQRRIEPGKGQLALPGGFIDRGEIWQMACVRELAQETGLRIDAARISLFDAHSTADGENLLIFGLAPPLALKDLPTFVPTAEASAITVIGQPVELAFPLHTRVMKDYFNR